jgi:aspartyl-tRNA(Asn)/glutamyl-tRNA(Gln) amidotransferase subunit A
MNETRPTLDQAAAALRDGSLTSVALTERLLERSDALDPQLGAWQVRFDEAALARAAAADAELAAGTDLGPLHGIPLAVKDIIAAAEGDTTAGSLIFDPEWGAGRDAPVVTRLRDAGAVIVGKTTTMEFALGSPDPAKPFPAPRTPWDPNAWAGGSSSGSGAAVGAGLALAALGTDTGGSIRVPAALCGVSGLMPTYGRVPKSGVVPLSYSLDHVGPLALSARDCALMLGVLAGPDPTDPSSVERPLADWAGSLRDSLEGMTIGVERQNFFPATVDPELRGVFDAAVAVLAERGATVVEVELPRYEEMLVANMVTINSEALAYHHADLQERWDDYFAGTRASFAQGAYITGADYVQAQRARRRAQRELTDLFTEVDAIVSPTCATGAIPYDAFDSDRASELDDLFQDLNVLFSLFFTPYWDCVGNPALAVPMGFTEAGMPLSLQIGGRPFDEQTVLDVGHAFQAATDWHARVPGLVEEVVR